ncbi:MAG TPA: hypothetical protein VF582_02225 [Allosphingosinicella sp.]|jgi:hypothetical protein
MLAQMAERVRRKAEQRAQELVLELTQRLRAELPGAIEAEADEGGVRLTGRNLRRRFALEPALRWLRLR